MGQEKIIIDNKEYHLYEDETVFRFTSALGCLLAEGHIFLKELKALKEFREKTISTEVFIYDRSSGLFIRADKYILEEK